MINRNSLLIIFSLTLLISCKEEQIVDHPPKVTSLIMTVQPVFGSQTLALDSTYTTQEGYDVQFSDIKFYMGSLRNGSSVLTDAGLFNFRTTGTTLLEVEGDKNDFGSMMAYLGIDSSVNHSDPSALDINSPLNISNANDMHWGWNPGYIFLKVEAKVDTIQDGNPLFDHFVTFHIGKDENRKDISFSGLNWQDQSDILSVLQLKLDMATFLNNGGSVIDLKTEFSSHTLAGQEVLSDKVISNFRDALTTY